MQERLQKILSQQGICSRRKAEEYILRGLVRVNGTVAKLGQKADPAVDRIEVDGRILEEREEMLYFLFHKPVGVVTSNVEYEAGEDEDGEIQQGYEVTKSAFQRAKGRLSGRRPQPGERTVRDLLPAELRGKVFPVGRLDKDSSGLLLLTNDGVLAYRLTHPKFYHEKEYEVQTDPPLTEGAVRKLRAGVMLDGSKTKPARITRHPDGLIRISLTEGRNRQIRRMCQKVGSAVTALRRIRIATLSDSRLAPGKLRPLTAAEREALLQNVLGDESSSR